MPALLRYAQPATAADSRSSRSTPHISSPVDMHAGQRLPPKATSSRQLTLPEHRPNVTPKLTQTRIKPERPQLQQYTSRPRPLGPSTFQNREGAISTSSSKNGTRKRLEIYQDDENAQPKRRRVKAGKGQGGDSDKENRNPADASTANRTKRVLGEITNTAKNAPAIQDRKGKSVLDSGTVTDKSSLQTKHPSGTARKVKDPQNTVTGATTVDTQKDAEIQTVCRPVAKVTKANKSAAMDSTSASTPVVIKGHKSSQIAEEEMEATTVQQLEVSSGLVNTEKDTSTNALVKRLSAPVEDTLSERQPSPEQITSEKPTSAITEGQDATTELRLQSLTAAESTPTKEELSKACEIIEVPGSVEGEQSLQSFESSIKQARKALVVSPPRIETSATWTNEQPEYEEVQDSQESLALQDLLPFHGALDPESPSVGVQDPQYAPSCHGSLEPTLPLPEFLLDHEYEEVPDSQESQSLQDVPMYSQDPTLPQPDFLLGYDTEEDKALDDTTNAETNGKVPSFPVLTAKSIAVASKLETASMEKHRVVESTHFADGVWCIDDCRQEVVSIVCGHGDLWIAVEMAKEIQFWGLQNDEGLSKSRWCNLFTHKKSCARTHQVKWRPHVSATLAKDTKLFGCRTNV